MIDEGRRKMTTAGPPRPSFQTLAPLRTQLQSLDAEILSLRARLTPSSSASTAQPQAYEDLDDVEKAQRLVVARQKTKEILEKRLA
jgi:hypothetical protein